MLPETKIDDTFHELQFYRKGYYKTPRLDRNSNGGGIPLNVREDN